MNNTFWQILFRCSNDTTSPTHTDNPKTSTIASQISRSINERAERANNVMVFNLQEQSNESDKNTIMNLCKINSFKFIHRSRGYL